MLRILFFILLEADRRVPVVRTRLFPWLGRYLWPLLHCLPLNMLEDRLGRYFESVPNLAVS